MPRKKLTRSEAMLVAQKDRTAWARKVDPKGFARFNVAATARTGTGARK